MIKLFLNGESLNLPTKLRKVKTFYCMMSLLLVIFLTEYVGHNIAASTSTFQSESVSPLTRFHFILSFSFLTIFLKMLAASVVGWWWWWGDCDQSQMDLWQKKETGMKLYYWLQYFPRVYWTQTLDDLIQVRVVLNFNFTQVANQF